MGKVMPGLLVGLNIKKSEDISAVVLLENAGSGGKVAAPLAENIFYKIFSSKNLAINDN